MFSLGRRRNLAVGTYNRAVLIHIREYFEADGELKPGKKGIALSSNQWAALKEKFHDVDNGLHASSDSEILLDLDKNIKISVSRYKGLS